MQHPGQSYFRTLWSIFQANWHHRARAVPGVLRQQIWTSNALAARIFLELDLPLAVRSIPQRTCRLPGST